jgi:hypothetical protein
MCFKRVKYIDVNGMKHAVEYLNSSKVKYNDDVVNINKQQNIRLKMFEVDNGRESKLIKVLISVEVKHGRILVFGPCL